MSDVKKNRIEYLRAIYTKAKEQDPVNPISLRFGLSKYGKLVDGHVELNENESGGYMIGETLGLTKTEVDAIVIHYCSLERQYLSSGLGMRMVGITQRGIDYLEHLDEQPESATAFTSNVINISGVENSAFQFQQGTEGSSQQQHAEISTNDFNKFCELIETDLKSAKITEAIKTEILEELEYAKKQHTRKRPIVEQLKNIGGFIKKIGIGVFTSLAASPLFEIIKPHIGLD